MPRFAPGFLFVRKLFSLFCIVVCNCENNCRSLGTPNKKKIMKDTYCAHGTIDYNDGDQTTYRGIEIDANGEITRFDTGDPVVDHFNLMKWFCQDDTPSRILWSSSFDHFFMDGDKYMEKYFDFNTLEFSQHGGSCVVTDEFNSFRDVQEYVKKLINKPD